MARSSETPRPGEVPAPGLAVFGPAVYTVGALFIVVPALDLLLNLWPMAPGELGWRYGALGLWANFLHTPLLGAVIVSLFAAAVRHRRTLVAFGWLWLLTGVMLLFALVVFSLDALQLRPTVLEESRIIYQTSVTRAVAKHFTAAIAFGLLGRAALRAARSMPTRAAAQPRARVVVPAASDKA